MQPEGFFVRGCRSGGLGEGACAVCDVGHRSLHAALLVRHASKLETHLHAGEGAENGELVGVAEVSDAEGLADAFDIGAI